MAEVGIRCHTGGQTEYTRPVGETVLRKLPLVRLKQGTQVWREMRKGIHLYLLEPQFPNDIRNRPAESGSTRKFCVSAERTKRG
jgi:hypothetical protein